MKTVTIRLSDVEAAMLAELQARKKEYKNLQQMIVRILRMIASCWSKSL